MKDTLKKRNIIGVCSAVVTELTECEVIDAICKFANGQGLKVQIFQTLEELKGDTANNRGERSVFELIDYEALCGLVIFGERLKDQNLVHQLIENAQKHDIPVISIDQQHEGCINVTYEYATAFELVVRHLVEDHHFTRFFVMAGMKDNEFSDERLQVVHRILGEHGIKLDDADIGYGCFWEEPTMQVMNHFFEEKRELPEAFIAFNDVMAVTICEELLKHGYTVPADVVVTGFDGIELSECYLPTITTAKQQLSLCGKSVVELICNYRQGNYEECHDVAIPFELKMRQSCGCEKPSATNTSRGIQHLYEKNKAYKYYNTFCDKMAQNMAADSTMDGILEGIYSLIAYMDYHKHIYVCMKKDYLKVDESFFEKVCEKNKAFRDDTQDMSILMEYHADQRKIEVFKAFHREEILADMEAVMEELQNIIILPLHTQDDVYGHVIMDYNEEDEDSFRIDIFISRLAMALQVIKQQKLIESSNNELRKAKERLEEMYLLDPLTNIYNRRGFYQEVPKLLDNKNGGWVTVISADLDRLKPINDTYGHSEGDFAIKTLGDSLQEFVREKGNGIYARFGGDEFVALLYQTEYEHKMATSIQTSLMNLMKARKDACNKPYDIQCSVGVIQVEWEPNLSVETLISKSDKLLYLMKKEHHGE